MKYKFIFDEGLLDNSYIELSDIEKRIVLITLAGRHNIMLSGYKTERLVKAIRLLRNQGTPYVRVEPSCTQNQLIGERSSRGLKQGFVTDADNGYLHVVGLNRFRCGVTDWLHTVMSNGWIKLSYAGDVVTLPAKFQLISETDHICENGEFRRVLKHCDIMYECKEDDERSLYSVAKMKEELDKISMYQLVTHGDNRGCDIKSTGDVDFSEVAKARMECNNYDIKTIRVAKTIADLDIRHLVFASDLREACNYNIV